MKQYTTSEQTDKLIELGFAYPKSCSGFSLDETKDAVFYYDYSIGELIEMLPDYINGNFVNWKIQTTRGDVKWSVGWDCFETGQFKWIRATELIDALYEMCVKLKEEGEI